MWSRNGKSSSSSIDELDDKRLSYANVGCTAPGALTWTPADGFRPFERTVMIGTGDDDWARMSTEIMQWCVKTRSGFRVETKIGSADSVVANENVWLVAELGFVQIREPVRVVEVVSTSTRCGYAYGTLEGHPVSGEEAFIVHRSGESVFFTLRSMTRFGSGAWRAGYPAVLIAQRWYRRRYLKAFA